MASVHWIDRVFALASSRRRIFAEGFGEAAQIHPILSDDWFAATPRPIDITWAAPPRVERGLVVRDGTFRSPVAALPGITCIAHVRELLPRVARPAPEQPMYVVFGATGEEGFAARTLFLRPIVESSGIGALLLENPLYGLRRPPGQRGTTVRTVGEQMLMTIGMIDEGRSLLRWLAEKGHTQLGTTGYSMGAAIAALVAARWPRPMAAAILGAGRSGVPVYIRGLLSRWVDFEHLGRGGGGAEEARQRLARYIEVLDLDRHPVPRCPAAAVIVGARHDGYVPADEVQRLHEHWKGSELRWLSTGHAGAVVRHMEALRQAAVEAMVRLGRATAGEPPRPR